MKGQVLFLGTGGSMGVPVIGCHCEVCLSDLPQNKRLRPSILIRVDSKQFLVDVGPDFRCQALKYGIDSLTGILFTHAHQDHTAGIDDLRPIYYKQHHPLPALLSRETAEEIKMRYYYIFKHTDEKKVFAPRIHLQILPDSPEGQVIFEGIPVTYVTYVQGGMRVNGYRIGDMAYLSDIRHFNESIFAPLQGVKTLIVSALKFAPSPLHLSVDEAIDFAHRVGAESTWLTHISHELDHDKANAYLPANIKVAYDGLKLDLG